MRNNRPRLLRTAAAVVVLWLVPNGNGQCPFSPIAPTLELRSEPVKGVLTPVPGLDTGSVPVILVHGNGSENADPYCGRWGNLISRWIAQGVGSTYKVYLFMHDTTKAVGFDGSGNAQDLAAAVFLNQSVSNAGPFAIVAHSRGGLVARSYVNMHSSGSRVFALVTLGTPHHGSPAAVPDWGLLAFSKYFIFHPVCFANLTYNVTSEETEICRFLGIPVRKQPVFDISRAGSVDLGWDNFDAPAFGIPYVVDFSIPTGGGTPLAVGVGSHTVSIADTNGAASDHGELDLDLHGPHTPGSLAQLNEFERYSSRIIAYGAYFQDPTTNKTLTDVLIGPDEHGRLSFAGRVMATFPSANTPLEHYAANDGLVPLQSALFLKPDNADEPIYETVKSFYAAGREVSYPLTLKNLTSRTFIKTRVFPGLDHLDLVQQDSVIDSIKQDLDLELAQVNQPPSAGFRMTTGTTTATDGTTLNAIVPVGGSATVAFNGESPNSSDSDGTLAAFQWSIDGAPAATTGTFTVALGKGSHAITLVVTDNDGLPSSAATGFVLVTEVATNQAPSAGFVMSAQGKSATQGQTLSFNVPPGGLLLVDFDGLPPRSSDPDGTIVTYEWKSNGTRIPDGTFTDGLMQCGFGKGSHTVTLEVIDNNGLRSGTAATATIVVDSTSLITEYIIPSVGGGPFEITSGPDGALWFTESTSAGNRIGRITTAGAVTEFPLPFDSSSPQGITGGPDGAIWFTEAARNTIGRITSAGVITEYTLPMPNSWPNYITEGPDGALWFTEGNGNKIGRITTGGGITEYQIPTPNSEPHGITLGPDGALWFLEFGLAANKIGRITPQGAITEYAIPTPGCRPWAITVGPDRALWFTEQTSGKIGRITTSGVITEFTVTAGASLIRGISAGPDGALWYAISAGNKIGRMTPEGVCSEDVLPAPNSFPIDVAVGPDGAIWFTEAGGKIGRRVLVACLPDITDEFTRQDGPVGNGWFNATGIADGNLLISSGVVVGPPGRAAIYRPATLAAAEGAVSISATVTQDGGFGGLGRYAGFLFGNDGSVLGGYGVFFSRSPQTGGELTISLIANGSQSLANAIATPVAFPFGATITPTVTLGSNGSITGSVSGNGVTYSFNLGTISRASLPGTNVAVYLQGASDGQSNPEIDNVSVRYGCNGAP